MFDTISYTDIFESTKKKGNHALSTLLASIQEHNNFPCTMILYNKLS